MQAKQLAVWILLPVTFACTFETRQERVIEPSGQQASDSPSDPLLLRYDHETGKALVLRALTITGYRRRLSAAHGMLGTSMLSCSVPDKVAYRLLFSFSAEADKMLANSRDGDFLLLERLDSTFSETRSFITKREAVISAVAYAIDSRFTFDRDGMWGRVYAPDLDRPGNEKNRRTLSVGLSFYRELKEEKGYDDETLRDSLGMLYACLEFDKVSLSQEPGRELLSLLGPLQVYEDALNASLGILKANILNSEEVLDVIAPQMGSRGLSSLDVMVFPNDEKQHQRLLELVSADLDQIETDTPP